MKPSSARQVWESALGSLELQVSRPSYTTWLKNTTGLSLEDNRLVVGAPSPFVAQWLEQRMSSLIEATLTQVIGHPTTVQFQVVTQPSALASRREGPAASSALLPDSANGHGSANGISRFYLNPRYTLESFVVGDSNQLAYAAAVAVSSRPGVTYNPLFLYGGVGLGKTHLLQGIGHSLANRGHSYLYVSSEQFTNEFITSIQTRRTQAFRDKYRSVDVLLVDDIQFIRGKEAVQESFFHTFNDLHNSNRQIVITCDRPSSELASLEERLQSRFQWGLSADIRMPDYETRRAILATKAADADVILPDDVLDMIASRFVSSIRELEGALNRICAYAELTGSPVDITMAYSSLGDLLPGQDNPVPSAEAIISNVGSFFDLDARTLAGKRRDKATTLARQIAIYLLRETVQLSLKDIGTLFGNRDHTTIQYAWAKVKKEKETNADLQCQIDTIMANLYT